MRLCMFKKDNDSPPDDGAGVISARVCMCVCVCVCVCVYSHARVAGRELIYACVARAEDCIRCMRVHAIVRDGASLHGALVIPATEKTRIGRWLTQAAAVL